MKKKFDIVFSIGNLCASTENLRKCQLQFATYPLDWVAGGDIIHRTKIMISGCENFIQLETLEKFAENMLSRVPKHVCKNTANQLVFNHDFPLHLPIEESFPAVKAKYDRRVARLQKQMAESDSILFVWVDSIIKGAESPYEKLEEAYELIKAKFDDKASFLVLKNEAGRSFKDRIEKDYNDNFKCITFDYNGYAELPHIVNPKGIIKIFSRISLTPKFLTPKQRILRIFAYIKLFITGKLW